MREKCKNILDKIFKIGYYLLGVAVIIALLGIVFDYSNSDLNGLLGIIAFIYFECLAINLLILKYYDLKDAARNREFDEFIPLGGSDIKWMIMYVFLALLPFMAIQKCN